MNDMKNTEHGIKGYCANWANRYFVLIGTDGPYDRSTIHTLSGSTLSVCVDLHEAISDALNHIRTKDTWADIYDVYTNTIHTRIERDDVGIYEHIVAMLRGVELNKEQTDDLTQLITSRMKRS